MARLCKRQKQSGSLNLKRKNSNLLNVEQPKFPDLQSHLNFLIQNVYNTGSNIMWTALIDTVNRRADTVNKATLNAMCPLLIQAMKSHVCGNRDIALRMALLWARYLWGTSKTDIRPAFTRLSVRREEVMYSSDFVLEAASLKSVRHWEKSGEEPAVTKRGPDPGMQESASLALAVGDYKLLEVLVQYNFWDGRMDSLKDDHKLDFFNVWKYFQTNFCRNRAKGVGARGRRKRSNDLEDIWLNLCDRDGRNSGLNQMGFRRVILIMQVLKAVVLPPESRNDYLRCLRVYFAALTDPMVSIDEVEEFVLKILGRDADRRAVDEFIEEYGNIFGQQPFAPRTLAHLSRCAVRRVLQKNKSASLPKLVEDLSISKTMKWFLMGDPELNSW